MSSEKDELMLDSDITLTAKTVSEIGSGEIEITSDIAKELLVKAPVEIELI